MKYFKPVVLFLFCCFKYIIATSLSSPKVETVNGLLTGVTFNEAHGFYGVPYGSDMGGQNRFKAPIPAQNYPNSALDVSINKYISCYQSATYCVEAVCDDITYTEDCLVLDIHIPTNIDLTDSSTPPTDRLPVLFWIHGGSFLTGSGTYPRFDGRYLSNVTNTVVVSINYRVGSLGFLVYSDESETINGNQGLKDQQLALNWVQQNIHKFGGDKDQVTLFGNSAGAQSVMFHLLSNVSAPMFHQAIQQSNPVGIKYNNMKEAKEDTSVFLNFTGCLKDGIKCLRSKNVKELDLSGSQMIESSFLRGKPNGEMEPYRPVIDGIEYKEDPLKLFKKGEWSNKKRTIVGSNTEEVITVGYPGIQPIYEEEFRQQQIHSFGGIIGNSVADYYLDKEGNPSAGTDLTYISDEIISDALFVCGSRILSRFVSASNDEAPVFLYSLAHGPNGANCSDLFQEYQCGHAFHTAENIFLMRTFPLVGYGFTNADWNVAKQFGYFWGNFAHSGNPNSGDVTSEDFPDWPTYVTSTWENVLIDSPNPVVEQNYKKEICDFWDSTGYYVEVGGGSVKTSQVSATMLLCALAILTQYL